MARPIHLRVLPRVEYDPTTLREIALATGTSLEAFQPPEKVTNLSPNFKVSYVKRMSALSQGASFLLDSIPIDYPGLTPAVRDKAKAVFDSNDRYFKERFETKLPPDDISEFKNALNQYSRLVVSTMRMLLGVSERTATKFLSKAEEYTALQHIRPDLMSLSTFVPDKKHPLKKVRILQRENPYTGLSPDTKKELMRIKALAHHEDMPAWYKLMAPLEKRFLRKILAEKVTDEASLERVFANQLSRLRTLPFAPNCRRHELIIMDEHNRVIFKSGRHASSMVSSRCLKEQENHMSQDEKERNSDVRIKHTFENLKQILLSSIDDAIDAQLEKEAKRQGGDEITLSIPYLIQTLISPLPVNFTPDASLADDKDRGVTELRRYVRETLNKKVWTKTIKGEGVHPKEIRVKVDVTPISLNHPLNHAAKFKYTGAKDGACRTFLDFVKSEKSKRDYLASDRELDCLLKQYEAVLEQDSFYKAVLTDYNARELCLSSLEQLIVDKMGGIASGSCVSGKDRKGIELLHTDAMEMYRLFYGEWPNFNEQNPEKRQQFVDICAHLFVSGHHQESAALNASGANGLKTPSMYLPSDVSLAVSALYQADNPNRPSPLDDQDVLASHNELKSMTGLKSVKANIDTRSDYDKLVNKGLKTLLEKTKLSKGVSIEGDAHVSACLHLINGLLKQEAFWSGKTVSVKKMLDPITSFFGGAAPILPKGIGECYDFLSKVDPKRPTPHKLLALYCHAVMGSSIDKKMRADETQALYRAIQELYYGRERAAEVELADTLLKTLAGHEQLQDAHLLDRASAVQLT